MWEGCHWMLSPQRAVRCKKTPTGRYTAALAVMCAGCFPTLGMWFGSISNGLLKHWLRVSTLHWIQMASLWKRALSFTLQKRSSSPYDRPWPELTQNQKKNWKRPPKHQLLARGTFGLKEMAAVPCRMAQRSCRLPGFLKACICWCILEPCLIKPSE